MAPSIPRLRLATIAPKLPTIGGAALDLALVTLPTLILGTRVARPLIARRLMGLVDTFLSSRPVISASTRTTNAQISFIGAKETASATVHRAVALAVILLSCP